MSAILDEKSFDGFAHIEKNVKDAIAFIRKNVASFDPGQVGVSFNGGKDSVVMVELLIAALGTSFFSKCVLFVLEEPDEFEELIEFRNNYVKNRLPSAFLLHSSASDSIREGLWRIKNETDIQMVFLGTRCTDPAGQHQCTPVSSTTVGWPPMLRVCPLFHWSVADVWNYIRLYRIPLCRLYEEGYSSLGSKSTSKKNPVLLSDTGEYKPAWCLRVDALERYGRS